MGSRDDKSMHEATRRVLSVLLQRVDGFQERGGNLLIGATNRKEDLDAALISRFDTSIRYQLPDWEARHAILKRQASLVIVISCKVHLLTLSVLCVAVQCILAMYVCVYCV